MAKKISQAVPKGGEPRKQRTRQHIIADMSVHYVEGFILENGYVGERILLDYGYDVTLQTFDEQGYMENGTIKLQIKATDSISRYELKHNKDILSFPISIKDYDLWKKELLPVFLILYDAAMRRAYWLYLQAYFAAHPLKKTSTQVIHLRIPKKNILRKGTIQLMRTKKNEILLYAEGLITHG